jgi:hypothetical protein
MYVLEVNTYQCHSYSESNGRKTYMALPKSSSRAVAISNLSVQHTITMEFRDSISLLKRMPELFSVLRETANEGISIELPMLWMFAER